ncbi:MAG: DUF748 domain-containing protein [Steroidobacteraceae bacterium]
MNLRERIRGLGRRWLITFSLIALALLAYLSAGYTLAPRLIRTEAMHWAQQHPGVTLSLGAIRVDPVHLTVSIRDIRLGEQGHAMASVQRLFIGLRPLALLAGTYHISALELDAPHLDVRIGADGRTNLAALTSSAHRAPNGRPPQIRIDDLRIEQGALRFSDRRRSPTARESLSHITFRLVNFRSSAGRGGQFALKANSSDGTHIAWWGAVSMAPLAVRGGVSVEDEPLTGLACFAPAHLPVTVRAGVLSLNTRYAVGEGPHGLALALSSLTLAVHALALNGGTVFDGALRARSIHLSGATLRLAAGAAPQGGLRALMLRGIRLEGSGAARGQHASLGELSLKHVRLHWPARRIAIATLALHGLTLPIQRERDGRLALLRLLPAHAAAYAPALGAHSAPRSAPSAPAPWSVHLAQLALSDATLPVRDRSVTPTARFEVRLFALTARQLDTDPKSAVPFSLRAGIAPRAYLVLDGRIVPGRRGAALWVSLSHLPLAPFVPYLPLARTAEVHSGSLGLRGFAELDHGRLMHLRGSAELSDLQLLARASGIGLFGWRALNVNGIDYQPGRLIVGNARLDAPVGRIVILPNHTLNLAALFPPAKPLAKPNAPAHSPRANVPKPAAALAVLLRQLQIVNGSIRFADDSISPHFHAPINDLHGSIENVSSARTAIARVALAGQVINRYSPVSIRGAFNPYGLGRDTDIRAGFRNIQLPIFDPYSDRYAGYAIAQGILSARFRYRIDNGRLTADHRIEIDQLQWGGASASGNRVGWPIRLATALLKDRNGVIRIHLPVTGSLNDPDFHIASIVWTMLLHLLEKAALAPFDLIGKLFAGAAQAQYIAFRPGSAALPHAAGPSLAALSRALAARPALNVDIPAGPGGPADAVALRNERIDALALTRIHRAPPGGFAALPASEQRKVLEALYRTRLHRRPVYPAPPVESPAASPPAKTSASAERLARLHQQIRWLRAQLRPTVHLARGALVALGRARAQIVQNALLAHGTLDPKRVFLTTEQSGQPWHGRIRLQLRLR